MINFYYFVNHPTSTFAYSAQDSGGTQMTTHSMPLECSKSNRDTHRKNGEVQNNEGHKDEAVKPEEE